ncbi:unnamed protein product, partial [Prorocentrum cordatum]
MLEDVKACAQDQQYWQVNIEAVAALEGDGAGVQPCDLADAIHCWLTEIVEGAPEAARAADAPGDACGAQPPEAPSLTAARQAAPPLSPPATPALEAHSRSHSPHSHSPHSHSPPGRGKQRSSCLAAPSPGGRLSTSSDCAGGSISKELHRSYELIEALRGLLDMRSSRARRALEELLGLQSSLGRQLHGQDSEISRLRESSEVLRQQRQDLEAELLRQVEAAEGHSDAAAEADMQRRRADALEREVLDIKEHYEQSCKEVQQLQAQVCEAERLQADVQRREATWGHRCEQLEQETERTDGHRQWMQAELSRQGSQLAGA